MTPKEKAEQLKEMFDGYVHYAERAVEEILKSNPTLITCNTSELNYGYWIEVKQEIEKL